MKTNSGSHTHNAITPDGAKHYRNLATGVGSDMPMIERTGARRSQRVADCMPADQRAALVPASGYPAAMPDPYCTVPGKGY